MNIALSMFCGKNKFNILLILAMGLLFWCKIAPFMILSYFVIYYFTNESLVKSNLVFYLITNFGCWLLWYPHTANGIIECYVMALPFLVRAYLVSFIYLKIMEMIYENEKVFDNRIAVCNDGSNMLGRYR